MTAVRLGVHHFMVVIVNENDIRWLLHLAPTHWNQISDIMHVAFSHAFSLNKTLVVCKLSLDVKLAISQRWSAKRSVLRKQEAWHYSHVIMSAIASQLTGVSIVYSAVGSGADHRKYQSSASLDFVREIHRSPVNSSHKGPVTRIMFPFGDVIMITENCPTT